jgi:6-phospho-beta-glucosidase
MNENKMVLANIGSGSSYLPDIAEMLIERKDIIKVGEWRLMDIDEYRLNCTGKYVINMFKDAGIDTKITLTQNLDEAVRNADYVMTTIRPGMSDGRSMDERIPFKHGLIGQETTAPGGMIMGFKTIPAMLEIAHAMERVAKQNAYLINLANPSGMIGEALEKYSKIKYACLCNGPTVIRNAMKEIYGAENPDDVFVQVTGLNHLIWCKVFFKGADVTDDAFKKLLDWSEVNIPALRREFVEPALQKFIGYIPMGPYLEFYYDFDTNFNDLQNYSGNHWKSMLEHVQKHVGDVLDDLIIPENAKRGEIVKIVEKRTFELYEKLDPRAYPLAANTRGGKGYGEAGIQLINALWNNTNEIFSPDVASMGSMQGFDASNVVTTTSLVNATGIHPICFPKLPGHMMSKIYAAKEYEKLAVEAAVTGSYHAALEALVANPLVNSYYKAESALNELLISEKEWLPQFASAIALLEKGEVPSI